MAQDGASLRPVQLSRLSTRGVLLGLSGLQLTTAATGLVVLVVALYAGGARGAVFSAPVWLAAAAATWLPVAGRPAIAWAPLVTHWWLRGATGQRSYRARVLRPRPAGTLALPGDAAALRQVEDPDTGAVMVHDPHAGTLTAILAVSHPSFALLDPGEQQRRVDGWGRVLAGACRSGRIARVQVLERTVPDIGSSMTGWWTERGAHDGSWASRTYGELVARATGERHLSTISLSVDLRSSARAVRAAGGGMRGAAAVMRQEMNSLTTALRAAELHPDGWLSAAELAAVLRSAYDPGAGASLERHRQVGRDLAWAGPLAVEESWDRLRSDSALHAVFWVAGWPLSSVLPGFLQPLLLAPGVRRAFTLLVDPVDARAAARTIRRAKVEHISDATQRRRIGQIDDVEQSAQLTDVLRQEQELAQGHGLVRTTGLLAVSAPDSTQLAAARAALEQAAVQSGCELRPLVGQQSQGFAAAALPLCRGGV